MGFLPGSLMLVPITKSGYTPTQLAMSSYNSSVFTMLTAGSALNFELFGLIDQCIILATALAMVPGF